MGQSLEDTLRHGWAEQQAGRLQEAERAYRAVLATNPREPSALHLLGTIALKVGKPAIAADLISRAIALRPEAAPFHLDLGAAQIALNQHEAATASFQLATELAVDPAHFRAAGRGFFTLGKSGEAARAFRSAIALAPDRPEAYAELGKLLLITNQPLEATSVLKNALARNPTDAGVLKDLGMAMATANQPAEAEKYLLTALPACPDDPYLANALGSVLGRQNKIGEAVVYFDRAISLLPPEKVGGEPSFHWNLGRSLLLLGQFERGWRECESRLACRELRLKRDFQQPQWSGEDLDSKTLLLHAEGGHGDAIQYIRLLPQVANKGGQILLECHPGLVRLLRDIPGIRQIHARGDPLPSFDFHLPLPSLPLILGTTLHTIPAMVPYLQAPADLMDRWRTRLADDPNFKIGLVWRGSTQLNDQRSRSISVFAPLANIPGVKFYGLQKGDAAAEPPSSGMNFVTLEAEITDFTDLAAAMNNLDLILTVDTAAAHLAGALGTPVWTLITYNPDFRWMLGREDSPWYPTMRLFRQSKPSHWADVIERIRGELVKLVSANDRPKHG